MAWTQRVAWFWREWLRGLLVVVLIVGSLRSAVADWNDVPTGSMKPTILEGDRIVVNKLAYDLKIPFTRLRIARWGAPQRGDIVVFGSPEDGTRLVKRVVGLPGDTVALVHNRLLINGKLVTYKSIETSSFPDFRPGPQPRQLAIEQLGEHAHPMMSTRGVNALRSYSTTTVPEGHYFMLGDNRDESKDSRYFGFVPASSIAGQAVGVALSVDRDHFLKPRWRRFFRALP